MFLNKRKNKYKRSSYNILRFGEDIGAAEVDVGDRKETDPDEKAL